MPHHAAMLMVSTAILLLAAVTTTGSQPLPDAVGRETTFLHSFDGRFAGTGRLERVNGSGHALTCSFKGFSESRRVVLDGRCSTAIIFGTSMRIDIQYNAGTGRYTGSFRESMGTIADLVGSRMGETLSLAFTETPESIRPNPPARLTITRRHRDIVLTLRGTKPGLGQNLDLVLRQS
ncbi:hypothetical protein [Rhizobium tubonense]|uniref:Uncharacterized protein n=1 Tax=Rhizobium tubonense TaxID=484088 RepID=A0A2W4EHL3_9HYPH|nr:hypothetical protein [Rhizobium tubonense]PZM10610.1 hypothetical protein CPY51_22865 [Rhizobium tubonense]